MNKNKYDFDNVIQKAPLTGKVYSRQGRITSTRKGGENQGTQGKNKFLTTSEKIFQAQNKLRNDKQKSKKDPEKKIKQIEEEINDLINESNLCLYDKQLIKALEVAKEAQKKMKYFERYLENNELTEFLNQELKFSVQMNLAQMYEKNKLVQEALAEYQNLLNAKANDTSFLVRVNMGNLHFQQKNYTLAIKMYKMSLDMAPSKFNAIKYKIMKNIGHSYVKKREFVEAITAYEDVMNKYPDYETAFNLILCLYTIGDKQKIKPAFTEMLNIETYWNIEEENQDYDELEEKQKIKEDPLIQELQIKRTKAIDYITNVAKLIAPVIEDNILRGYEWLIDTLKNSKFPDIQSEIEIAKALYYVKNQNIDTAIQTLKSFEKKDKKIMTLASSNLSFLYLLENDIDNAEKYADIALQYDRFNVKALVNKGNCYFNKNNFQKAKQHYLEAIGIQADCVEALYNLAFVNKKINLYSEALTALEKLRSVVSNSPEVVYQIASIYELHQDTKNALKWYDLLSNMVPNDPNILSKIGLLYSIQNDESQSFYHYLESFKLCPTNLETIAQLGIHYVRNVNYEKACYFFEKAAMLQPKDLKWKLMIASCQRRMENYEKALSLYEYVHNQDPQNQESLNFLVQINQELGKDCSEYQIKLKKLERELEAMEGGYVNFEEDYMQEQAQKNMHDDQDYQNQQQQPRVEERKQNQEINFEDEDIDLPDQLIFKKFYIYNLMVYLHNLFFKL